MATRPSFPLYGAPRLRVEVDAEEAIIYDVTGWRLGERLRWRSRGVPRGGIIVYIGGQQWFNNHIERERELKHWLDEEDLRACRMLWHRQRPRKPYLVIPWLAPMGLIVREDRLTASGRIGVPYYHVVPNTRSLERLDSYEERMTLVLPPRVTDWVQRPRPSRDAPHGTHTPITARSRAPDMDEEVDEDMRPDLAADPLPTRKRDRPTSRVR